VVSLVRALGSDILCTQEGLAGQLEELSRELDGMDRCGVCRNPEKPDEHSAIFFRKDRFSLVENGDFWLSETPDVPGSVGWDASMTRLSTWVLLADAQGPAPGRRARKLLVVNSHFDHKGAEARKNSAVLVAARAQEIALRTGADAVAITGDFNAEKIVSDTASSYARFRDAGFVDVFALAARADLGSCAGSTFHAFKGPAEANNPETWGVARTDVDTSTLGGATAMHIDWIMLRKWDPLTVLSASVHTAPIPSSGR
jgi:endonuclease/exonuclease/phosphatase family metal-dependent hydrolase